MPSKCIDTVKLYLSQKTLAPARRGSSSGDVVDKIEIEVIDFIKIETTDTETDTQSIHNETHISYSSKAGASDAKIRHDIKIASSEKYSRDCSRSKR